jgi:hypothetical protein
MAGKREFMEPRRGDKRYVRRDSEGRFKESEDVSRTVASAGSKTLPRSAKTRRVERALSSASERTGAFRKK